MNTNVLTEHALSVIYRHACRTYPRECCGFVLADAKVKEGTNIQDELHMADPRRYPRTAANGYTFSVTDTVFLNSSFKTCSPVSVIYHSHPDVGAYFSREDIDKDCMPGSQCCRSTTWLLMWPPATFAAQNCLPGATDALNAHESSGHRARTSRHLARS